MGLLDGKGKYPLGKMGKRPWGVGPGHSVTRKHVDKIVGATYKMLTNMSGVSLHGRRDDEETDSSRDLSKIRICSSKMVPTQKEAHTQD